MNISPYAYPGIIREPKQTTFVKNEENIISLVCQITGINWEKITGPRGSTSVSNARFLICYFLYKYITDNKSEIGRVIHKDHGAVLYALKKVPGYFDTDENFSELLNKITKVIES